MNTLKIGTGQTTFDKSTVGIYNDTLEPPWASKIFSAAMLLFSIYFILAAAGTVMYVYWMNGRFPFYNTLLNNFVVDFISGTTPIQTSTFFSNFSFYNFIIMAAILLLLSHAKSVPKRNYTFILIGTALFLIGSIIAIPAPQIYWPTLQPLALFLLLIAGLQRFIVIILSFFLISFTFADKKINIILPVVVLGSGVTSYLSEYYYLSMSHSLNYINLNSSPSILLFATAALLMILSILALNIGSNAPRR